MLKIPDEEGETGAVVPGATGPFGVAGVLGLGATGATGPVGLAGVLGLGAAGVLLVGV